MEIMDNRPQKASAMRKIPSPDSTKRPGSNGNSGFNPSSGNPLWTSNSRPSNISSLIPDERSRSDESVGTGSRTDPVSSECVFKVFAKLKPFPKGVKLTKQQLMLYKVINPAIFINLEDVEQDLTKNVDVVAKKFTFSESFGADVSQAQMFERVAKQQVIDLFAGKNSTVMTYGSTTSGKSYTLEGTLPNPGLIPRTLEFIFSREKPVSTPNYKPRSDNTIEVLNPERKKEEIDFKKKLLSSLRGESVNVFTKALRMLEEGWEFPGGVKLGPQHEIWLSFLEIRDEKCYDLLSPDYLTKHMPLESGTNAGEEIFVKGLSHLHVGSVTDARDVLTIGRNNLKEFNSTSNPKSSKFHCIFNITLLMYEEIDRPELVKMSRFSFCDLAAHQESDLDLSLVALVKSLRAYYETHAHPRPKSSEYFCPSKLTNLFKSSITGTSSFSLITHIDPNPGVYKDTHEALHFTAISTEILTKIRNPRTPQVTTTFGKLVVEGVGDFSDFDYLTPEEAINLASSFQHEISGYQALDLQASINVSRVLIKKINAMMHKVAGCYEQKMELLKHLQEPPADLMMHQESLKLLKCLFEKLQEEKELAEVELADAQEHFDEIMSDLPEEYKVNLQGKDPVLIELELEMKIKDEIERSESLIRSLNEARVDLNALNEDFEGDKLGELERKYITAKLDRDMDSMLDRHTKREFKNVLERVERLESEMERTKELQRAYEAKRKELSGEFMEIERSEVVHGDVDGVIGDEDGETVVIDSGSVSGERKRILRAREKLENTGNQVDKVHEVEASIPDSPGFTVQEIGEINSPDQFVLEDTNDWEKIRPEIVEELKNKSNILMEIDDSNGFKTELSDEKNRKPPTILADSCITVLESQEAPVHSETPVVPVPEHQISKTQAIPVSQIYPKGISLGGEVLPPPSIINPHPGHSTAVSSILEDWKSTESNTDGEAEIVEIMKESYSRGSSVTESSVDLQPPVLEDNALLENLTTMKSGLESLESHLETEKESNSSLQSDFNDLTPPILEPAVDSVEIESSPGDAKVLYGSEELTGTPMRRSKRAIPSTCTSGSMESLKFTGKKKAELVQIPENEVSPERDSPGVRVSSDISTPLRRSKRKKRRTRRFVSPFIKSTRSRSKLIESKEDNWREEESLYIWCDECKACIVEGNRYHCSTCLDGNFDLCPECFRNNGHNHKVESMMI